MAASDKCCGKLCLNNTPGSVTLELFGLATEKQKEEYVKKHVRVLPIKTKTTRTRKKERNYCKKYLIGKENVCKKAFLKLLGVSGNFVDKHVKYPSDRNEVEPKRKMAVGHQSKMETSISSTQISTTQIPIHVRTLGDFGDMGTDNGTTVPPMLGSKGTCNSHILKRQMSNTVEEFHRDGINIVHPVTGLQTTECDDSNCIVMEKINPKSDEELNRSNETSDSSVKELANSIAVCKKLTKLNVKNSFRECSSVITLSNGLVKMSPTLTTLDISKNEIRSASDSVAAVLEHHPSLKYLDISNCYIDASKIAIPLQKISGLETLSLAGNKIGKATKEIAKALECQVSLKNLMLADCCFEPCDIKIICDGITNNAKALEKLDLSGNNIGDNLDAVKSMKTALQGMTNVKYLYLDCCHLQPWGVQQICSSLEKCSKLEIFHIQENSIGYAASQLSKALDQMEFLQEIMLRDSHIVQSGVKEILHALKLKKHLGVVCLEGNPVSDACDLLAEVIKQNRNLTGLWFRSCQIDPFGIEKIVVALQYNSDSSKLEDFDLSNNILRCGNINATHSLVDVLKKHKKLKELWLTKANSGLQEEDEKLLENEFSHRLYLA